MVFLGAGGLRALILRTQAQRCCLPACVQPRQKRGLEMGPGQGGPQQRGRPLLYPLPFLSGSQSLQGPALSSHPRARSVDTGWLALT